MKTVYTAGPYRDNRGPYYIAQNIEAARAVALELWQQGYAVICPHSNSSLFDGACPDEAFLQGDLEFLKRCDAVVMLPRWQHSRGALAEHDLALSLGKAVYYWPEDRDKLAAHAREGEFEVIAGGKE